MSNNDKLWRIQGLVETIGQLPTHMLGDTLETILKAMWEVLEDMTESLQAVGSANYWKSAWETQCAENKKLYEALAASQCRERAAVGGGHNE